MFILERKWEFRIALGKFETLDLCFRISWNFRIVVAVQVFHGPLIVIMLSFVYFVCDLMN